MHHEEIIRLLADGVDPATGEVFPDDSPYHKPDVIRALHRAVGALQDTARKERKKVSRPGNQGKPWSTEAEKILVREFEAGRPLEELASKFGRSLSSIRSKLRGLGRDPDRGEDLPRAGRPRPPKEVDDSFVGEVFRRRPKWRV